MKNVLLIALLSMPSCLAAQQQKPQTQQALMPAVPAPIFVVDGKILPDKVKAAPDSTQMVSAIGSIDPNDIDKIEVLNGPSAIEKFGEAGRNGVVLIYTKKEKQPVNKKN